MKKIISILLILFSFVMPSLFFTACDSQNHNSSNQNSECSHNWEDWLIETDATCLENGLKSRICSKCEKVESQVVQALGHEFLNYITDNNATQTRDGTKTAICEREGCSKTNTITDFGSKIGTLEFSLDEATNTYKVIGIGTYNRTVLTIPNQYLGKDVTIIADGAFQACSKLQEIIIPNTIKIIGEDAFFGCNGITEIDIPDSVESIEETAFAFCDNLKSIKIGKGLVTLKALHFYESNKMSSIIVDEQNPHLSSVNNVLYNKSKTELLYYPASLTNKKFNIPSTVTKINSYSFHNNKYVEEVLMSNSVIEINGYAFENCLNLKNITMSNNITDMGHRVFKDCVSLQNCTIPNSMTIVNSYTFQGCINLQWIYISKNTRTIGINPFEGCINLNTIYYGGSQSQWNNLSYSSSKPSYAGIEIKYEQDMTCNHEVVIDKEIKPTCTSTGLTEGSHCLYCNTVIVKQIEIPIIDCIEEIIPVIEPTCTSFGYTEGSWCSMCNKYFIEPTQIPYSNHITEDIPAIEPTCTSSGNTAGKKCTVCKKIVEGCNYVYPIEHDYVDGFCKGCGKKYYSKGFTYRRENNYDLGLVSYITSYTGSDTEVQVPEYDGAYKIIGIEGCVFENMTQITKVVLPSTIKYIHGSVFKGCSNLESVNIQDVKSIGGYAFSECTSLKNIELGNSIKTISSYIFKGCSNLEYINIPLSVTTIEEGAFSNCIKIKSISIPEATITIGVRAFENCSNLETVEIFGKIKKISGSTFSNCSSLKSCKIPSTVTKIDGYAFSGCSSLIELKFKNKITDIGDYAFKNCTKLSIYFAQPLDNYDGWSNYWNASNCNTYYSCVFDEND